jgi:hypothetical protein
MARFATIVTLEEFKGLCRTKLGVGTDEFDPYELPSKIQSDLNKVQFDCENYCIGNADPSYERFPTDHQGYLDYPCGYETLENGLPVLFVNAGGDWETPICFVIYWSGKEMRAYIPSEGNCWNKKEKCAFGSDDEDEDSDEDEMQGYPDLIRSDVMNRIQLK